jgi:hypothetical protein
MEYFSNNIQVHQTFKFAALNKLLLDPISVRKQGWDQLTSLIPLHRMILG